MQYSERFGFTFLYLGWLWSIKSLPYELHLGSLDRIDLELKWSISCKLESSKREFKQSSYWIITYPTILDRWLESDDEWVLKRKQASCWQSAPYRGITPRESPRDCPERCTYRPTTAGAHLNARGHRASHRDTRANCYQAGGAREGKPGDDWKGPGTGRDWELIWGSKNTNKRATRWKSKFTSDKWVFQWDNNTGAKVAVTFHRVIALSPSLRAWWSTYLGFKISQVTWISLITRELAIRFIVLTHRKRF